MVRIVARALGVAVLLLATAACASSAPGNVPSSGSSSSGGASGGTSGSPAASAGASTATVQPGTPGPGGSAGTGSACIEKNAYDAYMKGPTSIETTGTPFVWDAFAYDIQHYDDPATLAWRTQLAAALQRRDVQAADALGADLVSGAVKLVRCP